MDEFFARNRLSAYLDGELSAAETREVEDALAQSPTLQAELETLRAGIALLRSGGRIPAPSGFASRLEARVAREPMRVGWTRHIRAVRPEVVLLAAAACLVLVFAGRRPEEVEVAAPEGDATQGEEAPVADAVPVADPDGTAVAEADGAPAVDAAGMPGVEAANGVLGDEPLARKSSMAKRPPGASKPSAKAEREAYTPAWEQQGAPAAPPTVQAPPRYRIQLTSETGLRDLEAIVRQYGGRLEDERGRPLAPYPMEVGDTRKVRLNIPSGTISAGQLYDRLQALGHTELTQTDTLYGGTGAAPIVVEVSRE